MDNDFFSFFCKAVGNCVKRRVLYKLNPAQGQFYSSIVQTDDGANAYYNALLLSLNHRFANHYTLLANYT